MSEISVSDGQKRITGFSWRPHPAVPIASVVCTFVFLIVIVFAIFAKDQIIVAAYITAALAAMGVCLALIASWRPSTSHE